MFPPATPTPLPTALTPTYSKEQEKQILEQQVKILESQLEVLRKRIEELSK